MVKSELIENLAERADVTLAKAEEVVDLFFDAVGDTLCKGDRVEIRGFGAFTVREYKAFILNDTRTPRNSIFFSIKKELGTPLNSISNTTP